ncbi:helix-turn-helix domain-containing protein [Rhizobium leguminosarum]
MARNASTPVTAQEEPNSIRTAFLRRATSALERISANVPAKDLADALSAPTDAGSLAQLLSRSDMVGAAINDLDPLVPALARNVEHRQNLVERAGGTMSAEDAGRILGISRQAVDKRRRAGTLLAVREGSDWRYPLCQLDQGEVIAGISDVVRGFAAAGPWIALDFLLASDAVLGGRTALQALRDGDREAVRRLIRIETSDGFA